MGAIEHLKTLCCLGLPPESAIIAVTPLLHDIIPHGWTRVGLLEPDTMIGTVYNENPAASALCRERLWHFMDDPLSPTALWMPAIRAGAIGWCLNHMQGRAWLNSGFYNEIDEPLDSCWMLDAVISHNGRSIAFVDLTRPRTAPPFNVGDVKTLDRLRPWLANAFRRQSPARAGSQDWELFCTAGQPVRSDQMILTSEGTIVFQTPGMEYFLRTLACEPVSYLRRLPARDKVPASIQRLIQRVVNAATGSLGDPPCMQASTVHGIVTLEAKWLLPAGVLPLTVARDPNGCLIAVTIELREHAIAHAARVLRECGATPAQVKIGIRLALGKTRPAIADELGIRPSSVADLTKKLYQRLDVHNPAELGTKIWLGEKRNEAHLSGAEG